MNRTFYMKTLGCKVNQYETQAMREALIKSGYAEVSEPEKADVVIVNSCTVTHVSDRKTLYYARRARRANPDAVIVLAGCIAEKKEKKELLALGHDIVINNSEKEKLPEILADYYKEEFSQCEEFAISEFKGHSRAFVKIQDGCNMRCSYCKICIVRGVSKSRSHDSVISEVRRLAHAGYKEIVLAGIQLGAYGRDLKKPDALPVLLREMCQISGVDRIRLSSIEPFDVRDDLIECMASEKKICPHLHIPLQSGDDGILKRMRRGYRSDDFCALIDKLCKQMSGFAFTTDVIVGFPGEDEAAFENTFKVLEKTKPFKMHIFPFSPREGTDAAGFDDRVSPQVIKKREERLYALQEANFRAVAEIFMGNRESVFIEDYDNDKGRYRARLAQYIPVYVFSERKLNAGESVFVCFDGFENDYLTARVD